ncbi:MAG: DNA mismatch endonuclease Vsr [Flavobacteriales bacterium]|nr:MAG: DNA mismatch endonuclease Vsr [Flavobacteriales bacterium]
MGYLRDGRSPVPRDARVSAAMSRIRAKDTGPELLARMVLRKAGFTGYRLHYAKAPGRPDITFVGRRIAVFVHGCFWHGCPHCTPRTPKSNHEFWTRKVSTNQARDRRKANALRHAGWQVHTVWECRLRRAPEQAMARVLKALVTGADQRRF